MEKMKEIVLPNSGKKKWMGGAYTLAFVYSKEGNYLLKGYMDEVRKYLKNKKHWFANFSLWHNGESRSIWMFWIDKVWLSKPDRKPSYFYDNEPLHSYKWTFKRYNHLDHKKDKIVQFRRLPKKWVKELEIF